jgi:glutathione peroxidase
LAFPCNQFGAQEPSCELDIKNFASSNYQADYPLFSKIEVNGANTHPLYQFLRAHSKLGEDGLEAVKPVTWNFEKFLVNADGTSVVNYHPKVAPNDIAADIAKHF